jgi:hypothetical protein
MSQRARRAGSSAGTLVLALALALAAAGCDLIGSLTPFGIGDRGEDTSQGTYTGAWSGPTSAAGQVTFTVTSGEVIDLVVTHTLPCGVIEQFEFTDALLIQNDEFSARRALDPQGTVSIRGRFTSSDSATGSYIFSSLATSGQCPTSGQGTFTASKAPAAN